LTAVFAKARIIHKYPAPSKPFLVFNPLVTFYLEARHVFKDAVPNNIRGADFKNQPQQFNVWWRF
jgi:hypothetical protein